MLTKNIAYNWSSRCLQVSIAFYAAQEEGFFYYVFNKQAYEQKNNAYIWIRKGKKNQNSMIWTNPDQRYGCKGQHKASSFFSFESFKRPKVGPKVSLDAPHSQLFLYITRIMEVLHFKKKPFLFHRLR